MLELFRKMENSEMDNVFQVTIILFMTNFVFKFCLSLLKFGLKIFSEPWDEIFGTGSVDCFKQGNYNYCSCFGNLFIFIFLLEPF